MTKKFFSPIRSIFEGVPIIQVGPSSFIYDKETGDRLRAEAEAEEAERRRMRLELDDDDPE